MAERVTALILAGSRQSGDPVADAAGHKWKALVPVAGRPMLERVIAALLASAPIGDIYISHNDPDDLTQAADSWLTPLSTQTKRIFPLRGDDHGPAASVGKALAQIPNPFPLLIVTADHPLLSPQIIRYFLTQAPGDCDLAAGLSNPDLVRQAYPDSVRTRLRLRDGAIGGCNLFLLRTPTAGNIVALWQRLEQHRKNPARMIREAGLILLLKFLFRRLSLGDILRVLKRKTGAVVAPVMIPFPEAAIDVDKPADLALVEKILSQPRL